MPVSGHGATWAVEFDPVATPGVFSAVAEINVDIKRARTHDETEVTPHDSDDDVYVVSPVRKRGAQQFTINMVFGRAGEVALKTLYNNATVFGARTRARGASISDYWIVSGQLTQFEETFPVRTGVRSLMVTHRPSGPMIDL